jgi:dTDP-4-dehydrorhamnose 3,5-epimerase
MIFTNTCVVGAFLVDLERSADERGFFARAWCAREMAAAGAASALAQANISFCRRLGTLRGMHYQIPPREEAKLMRCVRGAIYDVVLDVRPGSASYGRWMGAELTADNRRAIFVPPGCANGYLSLADDAEVLYLVSEFYSPEHERGIRWNDPTFGVEWPAEVRVISVKDRSWPDYQGRVDDHR